MADVDWKQIQASLDQQLKAWRKKWRDQAWKEADAIRQKYSPLIQDTRIDEARRNKVVADFMQEYHEALANLSPKFRIVPDDGGKFHFEWD